MLEILKILFEIPLFYLAILIVLGVGVMMFVEWRKMKKHE